MDHNNNRFSFAATWCDYNGDGWPDLYVTNDFGRKNLYRNHHGAFRDVAERGRRGGSRPGMSAAWLDYDGDGRPDLLVSNMWTSAASALSTTPLLFRGAIWRRPSTVTRKGNSLYHNNGEGRSLKSARRGHPGGPLVLVLRWAGFR